MSDGSYRQPRWYSRPLIYCTTAVLASTLLYSLLQGARYLSVTQDAEQQAEQTTDWFGKRVRGAKIRYERAKKSLDSLLGNEEQARQSLDTRITNLDSPQK